MAETKAAKSHEERVKLVCSILLRAEIAFFSHGLISISVLEYAHPE